MGFVMSRDEIHVGIAGLGRIGSTHARALASLRQQNRPVTVTAFSGGSPQRAAQCGWPSARQLPVDELVGSSQVDVLAVCTPSSTHAELTLAALDAGRQVVTEKPMSLTVEDAGEIMERAQQHGLLVSPIAQHRFQSEHTYIKSMLDQDQLGTVVLGESFVHWHRNDAYYAAASWRRDANGGNGSLMNQGLHNVDLLCWLLGGVKEVTGQTGTLGHEDLLIEDTCVATLRFCKGALGVIVTTTATPPGLPAELAIRTTTGSLRLSEDGGLHWGFTDVPPPPEVTRVGSGAADPTNIGIAGHVHQWCDIISALHDNRPPTIGAADGLATTAVLAGIYSATRGHTVQVATNTL
jgi:predicted dehydrogenase